MAAEPGLPDVHPQPDVSELASQFAHDVAEPAPPVEAFESEPAWNAATPDFVAAMETAAAEPPDGARAQPAPAGAEAFALSAELAAPAPLEDFADFALKGEPLAVRRVRSRSRRARSDETSHPRWRRRRKSASPSRSTSRRRRQPPAPAIPPPPAPVAPPPPPALIFAQVAQPPVAAPVAPPAPAPARAKAKPTKSIKTMAALEKMLRGIESRRAQIASEYRPS